MRGSADAIAGAESVLRLRPPPDAHRERAPLAVHLTVHDEEIAEVAVAALVEGACEVDARLDALEGAGPGELGQPLTHAWVRSRPHGALRFEDLLDTR